MNYPLALVQAVLVGGLCMLGGLRGLAQSELAPDTLAGRKLEMLYQGFGNPELIDLADGSFSFYFSNGLVVRGNYSYTRETSATGRLVTNATSPASEAGGVDVITLTFTASGEGAFVDVYTPAGGRAETLQGTFKVDPAGPVVPPTIVAQPVNQTVNAGGESFFLVTAQGSVPLVYQWQKDSVDLPGQTTHLLELKNVTAADAGGYRCLVTNRAGGAISTVVTLTVNPTATPPTISVQPQSLAVVAGQPAELGVEAAGDAPLSYQWSKDGVVLEGATNASLTLPSASAADVGAYTVAVANPGGTVVSQPATLSLLVLPAITQQPADLTAVQGLSATFRVAATGSMPLAYEWRRNGAAIPGATNAVYRMDATTPDQAGVYQVAITNAAGAVVSSNAVLTLVPPGPRVLSASLPPSAGGSTVTGRVLFLAQGNEQAVTFTLRYNTNALSQPTPSLVFASAPGAAGVPAGTSLVLDTSKLEEGALGMTVTLPVGEVLALGEHPIVDVTWGLAAGQSSLAAGLGFGESPVPVGAADGEGAALEVSWNVAVGQVPGVMPSGAVSQTGLFLQSLTVSNPGAAALAGVRVLVRNLGNASGVPIALQNATGRDAQGVPFIEYGPLAAGASIPLMLEYYVADRVTVPAPAFEVQPVASLTTVSTVGLGVVASLDRAEGGVYAVEFGTEAGRFYFVEYTHDLANWVTSLPAVQGTGSRVQWVDQGPPRTSSLPASVPLRSYRVLVGN